MISHEPASKISLMSIDPVVAEQVVAANDPNWLISEPSTRQTSVRDKTGNVKQQGTRKTGRADQGAKRKGHNRNNSLRRVKNSTEVLRQRSLRSRDAKAGSDERSVVKEPRNFTVSHVGSGGLIYLR